MSAVLARVAVLCLLVAMLSGLVMLAGCAGPRDGQRGSVDPAAFQFWVMPF